MRSHVTVQKNVETENLEADVAVLVATAVSARDLGLVSNAGLDSDVFDAAHDLVVVDTVLAHPL